MQKYSKLFKSPEHKHQEAMYLNDLLMQMDEEPLELMDKTIKRNFFK
ncbi:MAG: hypothetical protein ACTSWL_07295 [Promethearchaeota archaeon]